MTAMLGVGKVSVLAIASSSSETELHRCIHVVGEKREVGE